MSAHAIAPDRRMDRTRHAIRAAFLSLLAERGFAKLTMAGVAARANVGRSTLYEHYPTKYELLGQSFAAPFAVLAAVVANDQPPTTLVALLNHFRAQQVLARELFVAPATRKLVHRALAGCIEAQLAARSAQPACQPMIPLSLIAAQLAEAQLCLVEAWALGKTTCPAEQIAASLSASSIALATALLSQPTIAEHATP